MSDRVDRRRRSNVRQYSAEDQALNQISKEADARLQAKRAARAEAREIRLREIEKQQKEAEERQDKLHGLTSGDYVKSRQLSGSRRNSTDSTESMESNRDRDRDLRAENRDLEEKYKQAMMTSATLDNEKQTLIFQLELLKDQIEELEESHVELQREHKDRCRELEMKKRAYTELDAEVKMLKEYMVLKDKLIEESGFVIMSTEDGEYKLEKNESMPNGPVPSGSSVLLSPDSIALLKDAGEGSLGTATQHHLRSSPVHETKPSREGKTANTKPESLDSQISNVSQEGGNVNEKDTGIDGKGGCEHEDIPNNSGSVLAHEKELVEEKVSETDSNRNQAVVDSDIAGRVDQVVDNKDKEIELDTSLEVVETKVDSDIRVDDDNIDNKEQDKEEIQDKAEIALGESNYETENQAMSPVLALNLIKDSTDGIPRDDSGIFSPDDVAAHHSGFSSEKFDVKIIEPEHDTDEEGDEFFDAVSTPSPFLNNKPEGQYEFRDIEDLSKDAKECENEQVGEVVKTEDVKHKDSETKDDYEESVMETQIPPNSADAEEDSAQMEGGNRHEEIQEPEEKSEELESKADMSDSQSPESLKEDVTDDDTNSEKGIIETVTEGESKDGKNMTENNNENIPEGLNPDTCVDNEKEVCVTEKEDSSETDTMVKETDEVLTSVTDEDLQTTGSTEIAMNEENSQKEENKNRLTTEEEQENDDEDDFKDADSVESRNETKDDKNEVPSTEKITETDNHDSETEKKQEMKNSSRAKENDGTSVDVAVHDEIETCQENDAVAGDDVRGEVIVGYKMPTGQDQVDNVQETEEPEGESFGSSVDVGGADSIGETEAKNAATLDSDMNLVEDNKVDIGENEDAENVTVEGSSVDAEVKDEKDKMDAKVPSSNSFEKQNEKGNIPIKAEESSVSEDETSWDSKLEDEEKSDKILTYVEEKTEQDKVVDETNSENEEIVADDKCNLGAGTPSKDTGLKELDHINDNAEQGEDNIEVEGSLHCQEDTDETGEVKELEQNTQQNNDERPCDGDEKPCDEEKTEKQTTVEIENSTENKDSMVKQTCDSSVVEERKTEIVDDEKMTGEQTTVIDLEGKNQVDKTEGKALKRSEYSGDSDDDVFVEDGSGQKAEKDDKIPDSPLDTPEKKVGSGMRSEGELSEDDVLDEAYSFDDIDEVLEEGDEQKQDDNKKTSAPKEVPDAPKIVIEGPSTESTDNDENRGIYSSKKTSSSDSISTGSGKDVVVDPVSDDAMSTGSGAEGSVHPPPSPKEGKKGKKFGKFFKNIFK